MRKLYRAMYPVAAGALCRLFLAVAIITTVGCASQVVLVSADQDELEPGHGYLLIGFETNRPMYRVVIDGAKRLFLHRSELPYGNYYLLVELPAGEYYLDRVEIDTYQYYQMKREDWTFKVAPGQINYAGDVVMRSTGWRYPHANIHLANRSSFGLRFLEEQFPNIITERRVAFTGVGEDDFFGFARDLKMKEENRR